MANKLYKENGESLPAYQYVDDAAPPSGYTETDDPIDWDAAYRSLVGIATLPYTSDWRDKISLAYAALGVPTTDQKKAAARWFVIDKSIRDTVYNDAEQLSFAEVLSDRLNVQAGEVNSLATSTTIRDGDTIAVNEIVSQTQTFWKMPNVNLGDGATSGVSLFRAGAGGIQYAMDGGSDDEWSVNINLKELGVDYDGSDLEITIKYQLSAAPLSGNTVEFETQYALMGAGDDSDGAGTRFTDAVVQTGRSTGQVYIDKLPTKLTGVAGKNFLQLSIKRDSAGAGSDTYAGTIWITGIELNKV